MADDLTLDMSVFRVKEMRLISQQTGMKFSEAFKKLAAGEVDEDILAAFALVALRRQDPKATPEDAEEVDIMGLMAGMKLPGNTVPPTEGAVETS